MSRLEYDPHEYAGALDRREDHAPAASPAEAGSTAPANSSVGQCERGDRRDGTGRLNMCDRANRLCCYKCGRCSPQKREIVLKNPIRYSE